MTPLSATRKAWFAATALTALGLAGFYFAKPEAAPLTGALLTVSAVVLGAAPLAHARYPRLHLESRDTRFVLVVITCALAFNVFLAAAHLLPTTTPAPGAAPQPDIQTPIEPGNRRNTHAPART